MLGRKRSKSIDAYDMASDSEVCHHVIEKTGDAVQKTGLTRAECDYRSSLVHAALPDISEVDCSKLYPVEITIAQQHENSTANTVDRLDTIAIQLVPRTKTTKSKPIRSSGEQSIPKICHNS